MFYGPKSDAGEVGNVTGIRVCTWHTLNKMMLEFLLLWSKLDARALLNKPLLLMQKSDFSLPFNKVQ